MSLRSEIIERVAEELEADCNAEVALDTILDLLTERADEWLSLVDPGLEWNASSLAIADVRALAAVLREDAT